MEDYQKLALASYDSKNRYVPGYSILSEFSGPDRTVFQNHKSKKVVISYRGTNPGNWRDVSTDLLMAGNLYSHRFTKSDQVTKNIISKFGKHNVSLTGHSLGGSQALYFSNKYKVHSEAYNPYIHPSNWFGVGKGSSYEHAVIHHNYTDPISTGALFVGAKTRDYRFAGLFAHGIKKPFGS